MAKSISENGSAPSSPGLPLSKQQSAENTANNNHVNLLHTPDKLILPGDEIPHYNANPAPSDVTSTSSIPSSIPSSGGEVYGSNGDFHSSSTSDLPASSSSDYNIGPASEQGGKQVRKWILR